MDLFNCTRADLLLPGCLKARRSFLYLFYDFTVANVAAYYLIAVDSSKSNFISILFENQPGFGQVWRVASIADQEMLKTFCNKNLFNKFLFKN